MERSANETAAVDGLYSAFQSYEFAVESVGCAQCVSPAEEAVLRSTPLRDLTADQLRCFAVDAPDHWGTLDDYRHFLPRVLDVVLDDDFHHPDLGWLTTKLARAAWTTWPEVERKAIERYADAKWARLCNGIEEPHGPAEMMAAWACAGFDLRNWLDRLLADATDDGLAALAYFVCDERQFADGRVADAWWPKHVPTTLVAEWLVTPEVGAALHHAVGRDKATAWTIRAAVDLITHSAWAEDARGRS